MKRAKIGDIEISVVSSERLRHAAETTDKPVEKGQDASDHTKIRPPTVDIIGAVVGDDAGDKFQKLKKYQREGTLVKYVHRNAYNNMFITDIATTHEAKIANGFEFNISLKQLRIVSAKEVDIQVKSATTKTQVKPKTNKGLQQPQEKKIYDDPRDVIKDLIGTNFTNSQKLDRPKNPKEVLKEINGIYLLKRSTNL